ncbi:MAG: PEGA domain-containing protein [Myxococcota bacterium]
MTLLSLALTLAGAEEADVARARELFEVGRQAYSSGRYLVAARAFEAADALAPRSALIFSIGQSYRLQLALDGNPRHLDRALRAYREYLRRDPEGRRRTDAAVHLAALEERRTELGGPTRGEEDPSARRTELVVSASVPGATISLDGAPPEALPIAAAVAPGTHSVRVEAPGHALFETEVVVLEGRVTPLVARPEPLPARVQVEGADGGELYLEGQLVGRLPLAQPLEVPAGEPVLLVRRRGHVPKARKLRVEGGEARTVQIELEPSRQRKVAIGTFVAGGASALVAGGLAIAAVVTQSNARQVLDRSQTRPLSLDEANTYDDLRSARNQLWAGMGVMSGIAGVLLATGGVLFIADDPPVTSSTFGGLAVTEAGLGWQVRF